VWWLLLFRAYLSLLSWGLENQYGINNSNYKIAMHVRVFYQHQNGWAHIVKSANGLKRSDSSPRAHKDSQWPVRRHPPAHQKLPRRRHTCSAVAKLQRWELASRGLNPGSALLAVCKQIIFYCLARGCPIIVRVTCLSRSKPDDFGYFLAAWVL
jgi:hypothetical protein